MQNCTFCTKRQDEEDSKYLGRYFYAHFDNFPVSPGHAEVIPKRHVNSLLDLTDGEWSSLRPALARTIKIIETTNLQELYRQTLSSPVSDESRSFITKILKHPNIGSRPDGYNIGVNEGEAAGRTIHHMHIHVIPRFFGDVEDSTGGIRSIIPKMGNYKLRAR